jgi:hypothetical protein
MAQIIVPRFFPQPWAANELMPPLTPEEMAAGYPSGTSEKPTRQSINNALQYAINGVLYYLTTGVPAWVSDAVYGVSSIVMFSGGYFYSTADANVGQQPDALVGWERLPWRRSDLDGLYMTQEQANARFLSPESGDLRFYTQAAANALFLTQDNAAAQFVTKAALEASFLTTEQANALFLTQAQADQRYALRTDVVNRVSLATTLADFVTRANAEATFMTQEQADARFMTTEDAEAIFETQDDARATFLALDDAGLRIYRSNVSYIRGALVLDRWSGIIYVSQADENLNNSLLDSAWWRPWLTSVAADQNGLFLNSIEYARYGDFTINDFEVPLLSDHPDGIFLRVVLKGSGGYGGTATGVVGNGGGEGAMAEVILQGITAAMFPIDIHIPQNRTVTRVRFANDDTLTITAAAGSDGSTTNVGAGGTSVLLSTALQPFQVSIVRIPGANGRWAATGLRGGDGGGAYGGSGIIRNMPTSWSAGTRGCGGGGADAAGSGVGGPGLVQIFW